MVIRTNVSRGSLTDTNKKTGLAPLTDFAQARIQTAHRRYSGDAFGLDLDNTAYALDAITIGQWLRGQST